MSQLDGEEGRLSEGTADEDIDRVLARYEAALAATGDAVWEWNLEGGQDWWSRRVYELLEYDHTVTPSLEAFTARVHPEDLPDLSRRTEADVAGTVRTFEGQYRLVLPGNRVVIVNSRGHILRDSNGAPRRLVGVLRDVTSQKQLEEQLLQAHKMESIGRLAGGIAHDFNNLLTVILGSVTLAERQLPSGSAARSDLECVREAADRAANLTLQLLAFARRQVVEPTLIDLNELTRRMDRMLDRTLGEHVELVTVLAPDLGMVRADVGQMEQVLVNLAVNARDAMPSGGKLTIETANVTFEDAYTRTRTDLRAGPYVMLTVTDSGPGISPELRDHVFEPFFSTKENGTGLGLATCYGIVHQSGGTIVVDGEPGHGARFEILLPRAENTGEKSRTLSNRPSAPGHETILFVEDEPSVRRIGVRLLAGQGYRVLEAANGEQALRVAREHADPIQLLVTDVVMPGVSGPELAVRLRNMRPDIEVLFVSGYAENAFTHDSRPGFEAAFLQKPYTEMAFLAKIRATLND